MFDIDPPLTFARDLTLPAESRREHARSVIRGTEVRVARGVYADRAQFDSLDRASRYYARVRAIAQTRRNEPVLSHWSAAVVHGLPIVGDWPAAVHITQPPTSGLRTAAGVIRHSVPLDDFEIEQIGDMRVTSIARTVVDLAATATITAAVTVADAALLVDRFGGRAPCATRQQLFESWESRLPFRGHARSLDVIQFAVPNAESPIESVSRVNMRLIGCPPPQLQVAHFDRDGFIGESDFYWEEFNSIGEADGDQKYLNEAFRSGRSVEKVVLDEKIREDRMRALPRGFLRWRWVTAVDPVALRSRLKAAGIPVGRRLPAVVRFRDK